MSSIRERQVGSDLLSLLKLQGRHPNSRGDQTHNIRPFLASFYRGRIQHVKKYAFRFRLLSTVSNMAFFKLMFSGTEANATSVPKLDPA